MKRIKSNEGFLGPTHALSAVSLFMLLTYLASDFVFDTMLGTRSFIVYLTSLIIVTGASLMPDLDSVRSTSIKTLGLLGKALSAFMRSTSSIIQSTIKGKRDNPTGDPHRGFWHTAIAAVLAGVAVSSLTGINTKVPFELLGKPLTIGMLFTSVIIFMSINLTLAGLFGKHYAKMKRGGLISTLSFTIVSAIGSLLITFSLPSDINYGWVGFSVSVGWLIHLFGDMFTVAGVPLLFPYSHRGKRWWTYRWPLAVKAGGPIELGIIVPLFIFIGVVSFLKIAPLFI